MSAELHNAIGFVVTTSLVTLALFKVQRAVTNIRILRERNAFNPNNQNRTK